MQTKKIRETLIALSTAVICAGLGLFVLLPLLFPFLLGYALSALAEPFVAMLGEKTRLPRYLRSTLCLLALFAVIGVVVWFFVRVLVGEFTGFVQELPALLAQLSAPMARLRTWLTSQASRLPDGLGTSVRAWLDQLFEGSSLLADSLSRWLMSRLSTTVTRLPGVAFTAVTTVVSTFMISANLPDVKQWLRKHLPKKWLNGLRQLRLRFKSVMSGWLKAQLKLMLLVFAVLTAGFLLLRVEFPLLFGGLIALVDALPVLGVGVVLIPWAVISFLQGAPQLGAGLLALYGIVWLVRSVLEPRLVGKQIGMHPLATLIFVYVGFRVMGVGGMILFPIAAMLVKQVVDLLGPWRGKEQVAKESS